MNFEISKIKLSNFKNSKFEFSNFNVWNLKFQSLNFHIWTVVRSAQYKIISPLFEVRQATPSQWSSEENRKCAFGDEYSENCFIRPGGN